MTRIDTADALSRLAPRAQQGKPQPKGLAPCNP